MRLAALVVLCVPFALRASPLDPQLSAQLQTLRHGVPPKLSSAELKAEADSLIKRLLAFERLHAANKKLEAVPCGVFNGLTRTLTEDLVNTLKVFKGPVDDVNDPQGIDAYVRLQLLVPSFGKLSSFVSTNREAGFNFVGETSTCTYKNRAQFAAAYDLIAKDLLKFQLNAIGSPGQLDLERITERLLTLSLRQETHNGRLLVATQVGGFLLPLAAWRFGAPLLTNAFTTSFGGAGATLAGKRWFRSVAYWSFVALDMKVTNSIVEYLNPENAQRHEFDPEKIQLRFPSWEETTGDITKLTESSLHEPQLYLAYVSSLTAQLARVIQNWTGTHEAELKSAAADDPNLARELIETKYLIREAYFLNNTVPDEATMKLGDLLLGDLKLNVECGAGQFFTSKPSSIQCLIGRRRVARAAYRGLLKPADEAVGQITTVNLTTRKEFKLATTETDVRIDMPYKQPSERMAEFISSAYQSREVNARRKFLAQYALTLENFTASAQQTVTFDPRLRLSQRWAGLSTLLEIQQREPQLLRHADVEILITKKADAITEHHLGMRVAIAADATTNDTIDHLRKVLDDRVVEDTRRAQQILRERTQVIGQKIKDIWTVDVSCDGSGKLKFSQCLNTLKRLLTFAKSYPNVRPKVSELKAVGHGVPTGQFGIVASEGDRKKLHFLVRYGFKESQLHGFLRKQNWFVPQN